MIVKQTDLYRKSNRQADKMAFIRMQHTDILSYTKNAI